MATRRHWRSTAACQFADPEIFFPVSSSDLSLEQETEAKEICARCQVQQECLAFALRTRQVHGVWGGMSEQERYLLWRRDKRPASRGADERRSHRPPADNADVRSLSP